ncbi:PRC-barrel domain-containing protein [Terrihabitans rhizophilus]|jgi:sporulation protein YlmC with PRC-barrel domain|uniref:PRC-barrel domain-containing protein n=1 Tax=Terrihabitans rhizophilus TaxID=3092662 RepID=A0ABU4RKH9_9HYPH|nr:PRC-barrel domain-containing protein [Terrihabitans sp. PJ23]MDX6805342.1 PRC-barrel domain-containing protein [Terrihabitans sp. PJ23]
MLNKTICAALLASSMIVPAFAQAPAPAAGASGPVQFIEKVEMNKFRGSDLMGRTVYNDQNETIGDIGDVLLDKSGDVSAVVINVGGFLGLGASEVAVPFASLRFEAPSTNTASAAGTETGRAATGTAATGNDAAMNNTNANDPAAKGSGAAPENPNAASGTAPTGTTTSSAPANQSAANTNTDASRDSTLQDRIILSVSREDLEKAPKLDDSAAKPQQ